MPYEVPGTSRLFDFWSIIYGMYANARSNGRTAPAASAARGALRPAGSPGAVDEACLKGGC